MGKEQLLHHLVPFRREAEGLDSKASIGDTNPQTAKDRLSSYHPSIHSIHHSCCSLLVLDIEFVLLLSLSSFFLFRSHQIRSVPSMLVPRDTLIAKPLLNIADLAYDRKLLLGIPPDLLFLLGSRSPYCSRFSGTQNRVRLAQNT